MSVDGVEQVEDGGVEFLRQICQVQARVWPAYQGGRLCGRNWVRVPCQGGVSRDTFPSLRAVADAVKGISNMAVCGVVMGGHSSVSCLGLRHV